MCGMSTSYWRNFDIICTIFTCNVKQNKNEETKLVLLVCHVNDVNQNGHRRCENAQNEIKREHTSKATVSYIPFPSLSFSSSLERSDKIENEHFCSHLFAMPHTLPFC